MATRELPSVLLVADALDVYVLEHLYLRIITSEYLVDLVSVRVVTLFVFFFLGRCKRFIVRAIVCRKRVAKTNQELLLVLLRRLVIKATGLNDLIVDVKLIPRPSIHHFLHPLQRGKSQNPRCLCLFNTMRTVPRLQICVRDPVRAKDNDCVG